MPHNPIILPVIALAVLVVLAVVAKVLRAGGSKQAKFDGYYLKSSLFSPAERSFLGVLESLDTSEYRFMAKVRLADIFGVKKGQGWQSAFNRISAKHVDFLLVRQSDGAPVLGIELDDSSHDEPVRKDRDRFVDTVFETAGLSILHVPASRSYDPRVIREEILIAVLRKDMKRSV
jgi:very-short-patch-repair endonuclease